MDQILVAFITGLTTGGLSCLAVQGGLLASSLGRQIEQDMLHRAKATRGGKQTAGPARGDLLFPILFFLSAKLVSYTLLGLLLGALGSIFQLTTVTRAILLMAIGIFMVGNALRMLNVHPFFRYFTIEPPKFITRVIRRKARGEVDKFTPLFLGALTVFIPCGVTQAMMAVAVGTGNPLTGAALMFAFTLGTSPVFFLVAYLTTQIGKRLEKWFMRFVAGTVLVLGLLSINSGLTLVGSPFSMQNLLQSTGDRDTHAIIEASLGNTLVASEGTLLLNATNTGYSPQLLHAPAETDLNLTVLTEDTYSCARAFVIPSLSVEVLLPESGTVPIEIPAQTAGTVMHFSCSMGMYSGQIVFDQ